MGSGGVTLLAAVCAASHSKERRAKGEECAIRGHGEGGEEEEGEKKKNMFLNLADSICNFLLHCSFLCISPWLITR